MSPPRGAVGPGHQGTGSWSDSGSGLSRTCTQNGAHRQDPSVGGRPATGGRGSVETHRVSNTTLTTVVADPQGNAGSGRTGLDPRGPVAPGPGGKQGKGGGSGP